MVCFSCLQESKVDHSFRKLARPVVKSLFSMFVHANVCISDFALHRFKLRRKQVILGGIDTTQFRPNTDARRNGLPRVVFVGRLIPEKGCHVLIEALRLSATRAKPFILDIVGTGPQQSWLASVVASSDLLQLVCFRGAHRGAALVEILQQADIAVVPSLWDEPFGLVAIEAMACGLPVIGSNVGGLKEITDRAGLSFPRGDADALSALLCELLSDDRRRRFMGRQARNVAIEEFDQRIMSAHYHELFRQLVSPAKSDSA